MRERQAVLYETFITTVISCAFAGSLLARNPPETGQPGVGCEDIRTDRLISDFLSLRSALPREPPRQRRSN